MGDLFRRNINKVGPFWEKFANQPIQIFHRTFLPWAGGGTEIHGQTQLVFHFGITAKFGALVGCEGMTGKRANYAGQHSENMALAVAPFQKNQDTEPTLPVAHGQNPGLALFAAGDNRIQLPIPDPFPAPNLSATLFQGSDSKKLSAAFSMLAPFMP